MVVGDALACPICLSDVPWRDESFTDACFHRFCFQWSEVQRRYPLPTGSPDCACPLCKTPYKSIIHNCYTSAYRRHWVVPRDRRRDVWDGSAIEPTFNQCRRRSVYFNQGLLTPAAAETRHTFSSSAREHVRPWLQRELQALILEDDVTLAVQHILGTAHSVEKTQQQPRGRKTPENAPQAAQEQEWLARVACAAQPFVFEHAGQLAKELRSFVLSGLTVAAYDRLVFGESSPQTRTSVESEGRARARSVPVVMSEGSSGGDADREEGELSEVVEEEEHMLSLSISSEVEILECGEEVNQSAPEEAAGSAMAGSKEGQGDSQGAEEPSSPLAALASPAPGAVEEVPASPVCASTQQGAEANGQAAERGTGAAAAPEMPFATAGPAGDERPKPQVVATPAAPAAPAPDVVAAPKPARGGHRLVFAPKPSLKAQGSLPQPAAGAGPRGDVVRPGGGEPAMLRAPLAEPVAPRKQQPLRRNAPTQPTAQHPLPERHGEQPGSQRAQQEAAGAAAAGPEQSKIALRPAAKREQIAWRPDAGRGGGGDRPAATSLAARRSAQESAAAAENDYAGRPSDAPAASRAVQLRPSAQENRAGPSQSNLVSLGPAALSTRRAESHLSAQKRPADERGLRDQGPDGRGFMRGFSPIPDNRAGRRRTEPAVLGRRDSGMEGDWTHDRFDPGDDPGLALEPAEHLKSSRAHPAQPLDEAAWAKADATFGGPRSAGNGGVAEGRLQYQRSLPLPVQMPPHPELLQPPELLVGDAEGPGPRAGGEPVGRRSKKRHKSKHGHHKSKTQDVDANEPIAKRQKRHSDKGKRKHGQALGNGSSDGLAGLKVGGADALDTLRMQALRNAAKTKTTRD